MKSIFSFFFLIPTISFAFDGPFAGKKYPSFCKGQVTSADGYSIVCKKAQNSAQVLKARKTIKVERIGFDAFSAVDDFDVMPDADTNSIYVYKNQLFNNAGQLVGFLVISGYENSEMEYKMQLTQRLNLNGELVSAKIKD